MSRDGSIEFEWADGTHKFRLAIGQIRELQEKLGVGPFALLTRLINNEWKVDDAREVIRLALIGGGKSPLEALDLVKRYVEARPLMEAIEPSIRIMSAAMFGPPEEQVGKAEAPAKAAPETTDLSSPPSTAPAP